MGEFQHIPVLLEECMEGLALRPNGIRSEEHTSELQSQR